MELVEVVSGLYRILAVCDGRGECQLLDLLGSAEEAADVEARKMLVLLRFAAKQGPPRNEEKSKSLGDDIFEFKTTDLRVLYFYDSNRLIICSHGFVKKTRKCPPSEKTAAIRNRELYFGAKAQGELRIR